MCAARVRSAHPPAQPGSPGQIALIAIYLFNASVVVRILTSSDAQPFLDRYIRLIAAHLVLYTLFFARLRLPDFLRHLYFAVQSALVIVMLTLNPDVDIVTAFFIPLSYQIGLSFSGISLTAWVIALMVLTFGPLSYYFGLLEGLASTLTSIAGVIVIPAYVKVSQEIEAARLRSQALLSELQKTNQQLQAYAGQVEELAAIEARNHLARELHDGVSQLLFSIVLTTRSAQLLLEKDPHRLPELLEQLKLMTGEALAHLRALITQMRPPQPTG